MIHGENNNFINKKFVIVVFKNENDNRGKCSMEVIPSCLLIGADMCYWPPKRTSLSRIGHYIETCAKYEINWQRFSIKILSSTDNLKSANELAEKILYTSNVETEDSEFETEHCTKKTKPFLDAESDGDISDVSAKMCGLKKSTKKSKFTPSVFNPVIMSKTPDRLDVPAAEITEVPTRFESQIDFAVNKAKLQHFDQHAFAMRFFAFEKSCLDLLNGDRYDIKNIRNRLDNIENRLQTFKEPAIDQTMLASTTLQTQWHNILPILSEIDLENIEMMIAEKTVSDSLVCHLVLLGGENYKRMTTDVIKSMFSKQVSLSYSAHGKKVAVRRRFPEATEKQIRERIGSCLTTSRD
nr:uncharacterized protein LOC101240891 isoform X3 [Hydra vulgaris]